MKIKSIKHTVSKTAKRWIENNLNNESVKTSVIEFLENRKENVILSSLGFKRDSWNNDIVVVDRHSDCIVTRTIKDKVHKVARDWVLANTDIFKELQIAPKTIQSVKKTYKQYLLDELSSMAQEKARDDAHDVYSKLIKDSLSEISGDFEKGEIQIKKYNRY